MCFLVGQKKLEDKYKDPDMLLKINKSDMAGTMQSIKEYLRAHHGVIKEPLAYVIRKTYADYPTHETPDDEMITRMLNLPQHKNKLLLESSLDKVRDGMPEYTINIRMVYDILDQICKDTDPYIKQHNTPRDRRGAFYAIHSRWLAPNHVKVTASEAKMAIQT